MQGLASPKREFQSKRANNLVTPHDWQRIGALGDPGSQLTDVKFHHYRGATIEDVLNSLFPRGTTDEKTAAWDKVPLFPTDVFAIAAVLVELSGAYHHVVPVTDIVPPEIDIARSVPITDEIRREVCQIANKWRRADEKDFVHPAQPLWDELLTSRHTEVFYALPLSSPAPRWWSVAIRLLMAADEASAGLGLPTDTAPFNDLLTLEGVKVAPPFTQTVLASPDFACVQPKSRTPSVGCTIRSLSHHLALLPSRGSARAHWRHYRAVEEAKAKDDSKPLNLVLIPFPYAISARSFVAGENHSRLQWAWFDVNQRWLVPDGDYKSASEETRRKARDNIADFITKVVSKAGEDVGEIHGVILPELALDWDTFQTVYHRLTSVGRNQKHLEFFISGIGCEEDGRKGNFVATIIHNNDAPLDKVTLVRQKHHRWRLDADQIRRYNLASTLDPKNSWWENIGIVSRSIDVSVFRQGSTLTTLICEDLARIDPVQQLVRSIGPNLVIALLMDSAQHRARWPARYATVLAEDPGSSVLTLTSLGLVERVNAALPPSEQSRSISLWRDDAGGLREVVLPPGSHAMLVTLSGSRRVERTLDGRSDDSAVSWRFDGQTPIQIDVERDTEWMMRPN